MPIVPQGQAIQPCVVSGNIQLLSNGAIQQGVVIFQLYNIGTGSMPQVPGIGSFPNLKFPAMTDLTGTFSTTLWGNDVIQPLNTLYLVTCKDFYSNEVGPVLYKVQGSSFNLNTAQPSSGTVPPVYTQTTYAAGVPVATSNFTISGWGTGATVTNIQGVQQRCSITITAGASPSIAPTVIFNYPGAYPTLSMPIGQMTGGTGAVSDLTSTGTTASATFTYTSLPQAASTYILTFDTIGI